MLYIYNVEQAVPTIYYLYYIFIEFKYAFKV